MPPLGTQGAEMTKLGEVALAINANLKKQWKATPAPGREFDPNSWTAESGEIDLIELARAALETLRNPSISQIKAGCIFCRRDPSQSMDSADKCFRAMIQSVLDEKP